MKSKETLSVEELNAARPAVLKRGLKESFLDAYETISKGQPWSTSDQLNRKLLFLGENGMLRLQGQLKIASSTYDVKHPIVLAAKLHVVMKLIEDAHQTNFH